MNTIAINKILLVACLAGMPFFLAAEQTPPERRYLNEVFDKHVRTPDIVFTEAVNNITGKTEKLTMRVFEPKGDKVKSRPLFILTPGGGFTVHEDFWMDMFGEQMARAGYVVAINRYRLSKSIDTTDKYLDALGKAVADQRSVIEFFIRDAAGPNKFRIDPDKIFIGGHSAGAITSMHLAYLDRSDEIDTAMTKAFNTHDANPGNAMPGIRGVINLSGLLTDLDIIDKGGPPLLSLHGDKDDVIAVGTNEEANVHGSLSIHQYAEKVGLKSELNIIRGAGHNDPSDTVLCPECVPLVRRFMYNVLNGE